MASPFDINAFRAALKKDGQRSNQFQINLLAPLFVGLDSRQLSFMAMSSGVPSLSVGRVEQGYFGRRIKVAGDAQVSDWQIEVINDETFDLRGAFERWMNGMAHMSTRLGRQRSGGANASPNSYVGQAIINQYGKEGSVSRAYKLTNVWPTEVSGMGLSWNDENQIQTFSVTFSMDWMEILPTGTAGTPDIN